MLNSYQHYFPVISNTGSVSSTFYHLEDDGYYLQRIIFIFQQVGSLYVENSPGTWSPIGEAVYKFDHTNSSNNTSNFLNYINTFYADDWAYGFPASTDPIFNIREDDENGEQYIGSTSITRTDKRIGINLDSISFPLVNVIFGTSEGIIYTTYSGHTYTLSGYDNLTNDRPESEGGGSNPPSSGATYSVNLMNCDDGRIQLSDNLLTLSEAQNYGYEISGTNAYLISSTA